jgi:apoptogenic protein 1
MLSSTIVRCSKQGRLTWNATRRIHASPSVRNFIGPPDPVSNLRPMIYDDDIPSTSSIGTTHPYSLSEFKPDVAAEEREEMEYQYKSERQQLDNFNHRFWTDVCAFFLCSGTSSPSLQSNTRFEAGKAAVLVSLPSETSAADRERALSDFYGKWIQQEKHRQDDYSKQWRARNVSEIQLAVRLGYQKFRARAGSIFS